MVGTVTRIVDRTGRLIPTGLQSIIKMGINGHEKSSGNRKLRKYATSMWRFNLPAFKLLRISMRRRTIRHLYGTPQFRYAARAARVSVLYDQ